MEDAVEQLLAAAKQGHGGALAFLGDIYLDGAPGIEANPSVARGLYARAVASGFEPAKKILSEFEDYTERVTAAEKELKSSPNGVQVASGPKTIPGYANEYTSVYTGPKPTELNAACFPEKQFEFEMRKGQFSMKVSALQAFIDPGKHRSWLSSTHNIEGDSVSGEQLDGFLAINTDRDTIYRAEEQMKEGGMPRRQAERETNEMQSYLYGLLKKRFDSIVDSRNLFKLYTSGFENSSGVLVTEVGDATCITHQLSSVHLRNYESTTLPEWIRADSNFAKAVRKYNTELSYGVTAFGKMANGDTFIVLSSPKYKPGSYGGPVPFLFTGVVLVGDDTKDQKPALFGNLLHVQYSVPPDRLKK